MEREVPQTVLRSMTGYGRGENAAAGKLATVEVKSVNHRFLEVAVRLPRPYALLEDRVRRLVKDRVSRGRVDVFCNVEDEGEKQRQVKLDKALAAAYYNSLRELQEFLDFPGNVSFGQLLELPGVLNIEEPEETLEDVWALLQPALERALQAMLAMREEEGRALAADLMVRQQVIGGLVARVAERAPAVVEEYRQKLQARLDELLGDIAVDEARLAQEVAIMAERSSIAEELVRLESHLAQLGALLAAGGSQGRRLDFLLQEFHREINTIGAKSSDLTISQLVVELKHEVEKVREQVQNLE